MAKVFDDVVVGKALEKGDLVQEACLYLYDSSTKLRHSNFFFFCFVLFCLFVICYSFCFGYQGEPRQAPS